MPRMGFERTIPGFEPVHALDGANTMIGGLDTE
jgi:hypothetical protein